MTHQPGLTLVLVSSRCVVSIPPERLSVVVYQATGIVAVQADCGVIEAFDLLRDRAQLMDESLHDMALDVIDGVIRFGPPA